MAPLSHVIIYNKVCISRGKVWMVIAQTLFRNSFKEYESDELSTVNHTIISVTSSSYHFIMWSASGPGSVTLCPYKLSTSYHQVLSLISSRIRVERWKKVMNSKKKWACVLRKLNGFDPSSLWHIRGSCVGCSRLIRTSNDEPQKEWAESWSRGIENDWN